MLQFAIDKDLCTKCSLCASDCPVNVISLDDGFPVISAENEGKCLRCQHCLAICPTAALSILGNDPQDSLALQGNLPDPMQIETHIKGRRSVRQYRDENLDPQLLRKLLDVAWHAPTGVNRQQLRFHVIDNKEALAIFREEVYAALAELVQKEQLPERMAHFYGIIGAWQEKGIDILFRGAPHLLVISTTPQSVCPEADGMIAMSYFELYAQSQGVGTVWDGLAKWALTELVPGLQQRLGIPQDHRLSYVMAFGLPAVRYQRTVNREPADVVFFKG